MSSTFEPLIYVMIFIAVVMLVQATASSVFSASDSSKRINRRLTLLESGMSRDEAYFSLMQVSSLPELGNQQLREWLKQMETFRRQANVSATLPQIGIAAAVAAMALWAVSVLRLLLTSSLTVNGVIVTLVGAVTLPVVAGYMWLSHQRNKRLRLIDEQLPLALDIMHRALRAGHPVVSALQLAATEIGDPLGTEFGLVVDETLYGMELRDSLASFAQRVGSQECHFFVSAWAFNPRPAATSVKSSKAWRRSCGAEPLSVGGSRQCRAKVAQLRR
jgi:tight adherence protein B